MKLLALLVLAVFFPTRVGSFLLVSPTPRAVARVGHALTAMTPSWMASDSATSGEQFDSSEHRGDFLANAGAAALGIIALTNTAEEAFAGGLERPSAKGLAETSINLKGTGKQPISVSVLYPQKWIVTKNPGKLISIQDYKYADRAFAMSEPLPKSTKDVEDLPLSFYTDLLFGLNGPYGNYGKVDDFKVLESKKIVKGKREYRYVDLKFAPLTQQMTQVERRACVASTIVGNDVVIFTASILATRWGRLSEVLADMVESFRADLPQTTRDPTTLPFNRL